MGWEDTKRNGMGRHEEDPSRTPRCRYRSARAASRAARGQSTSRSSPRPLRAWGRALFLQITDIIDTDDVVAGIADGLIAGGVRLAQDVDVPVETFALRDRRDRFALGVQNRADGP